MDKNELVNKIRGIEGLTNDEKSALIELLHKQKKYGLVWEDKPEDVEERLREELPVLIEDTDKAIISEEADAPNHILIEGDNLEALTALSYTHEGKIDVIYIDPPYNTGNKDFVYNDSFVDSEDGYRHSKWLSFMSKRLTIAKRLLSKRGVIFISIDENELGQLKLLGDEIWSGNFVGQWNWFKSSTPPALSKKVKKNVEYILCWQSSGNTEKFKGIQKISKSNDPFTKPQNSYKELLFPSKSITCKLPDGIYQPGVYGTEKFPNELLDTLEVRNGKNAYAVRFKNRFIWIQDTLNKNIDNGLYIELSKSLVLSYKRVNYSPEIPPNFIDISVGVDTTENAGRHLMEIFNNQKVFDYPKPVSLIKYILGFSYNDDITILDFFAGSGTTLHATMQLNAEDGGHRKCILVTNNENNICENVTYERNKRVIQGYTTPKGEEVPGLTANTLRYYKTDFISRDRTPRNMRALVAASTGMLCIKNDIYREAKLAGRNINPKIARYFEEGDRSMLIIYDERAISAIAEILETVEPDKEKIKVYVFSASSYAYNDEFEEVADKVQLCALPDAIYQAYQKVLPKRRPKFLPEAMEEVGQSNSPENGMLNFSNEEAGA